MQAMRLPRRLIVTLSIALAMAGVASAATPTIPFRVFTHTKLRLTDIVWTGRQFLYVDNTTNRVAASGPSGAPLTPFAAMPRQVEETRCRVSPGAHGFARDDVYCHSPDNKIYRISPDGKSVTIFATLPDSPRSDGALAFDTVGTFGYTLLVATGRSGSASSRGGALFTISATGVVRRIGSYVTPGGADEMAVAPATFGTASGQALLAVDAGGKGSLVAIDAHGGVRTLATLPDGPNPIAVLTPGAGARPGAAKAGLYVTDTSSHDVYFVSAADLSSFSGAVIVGSELRGLFWIVRPQGNDFTAITLPTNLRGKKYNFEGAVYIAS